ncbi:spore coat protein [Paenibacillus xanthanilyticus]|uniref:Spore coat protein n=1 Tax=Paenibacillus xanthanilyticus TaxID=1783531 RepID=A0ABV8K2L9_9BACL
MFQQSNGQNQSHTHLLAEEDLAYTVLADLKRVSGEYATAVTESNSPDIRQVFTSLLNSTLRLQGELYRAMQQNNLYDTPTSALRQEVDKQLQKQQQSQQKAAQLLQKVGLQPQSQGQFQPQQAANSRQQFQQPQQAQPVNAQAQQFQQTQMPVAAGAFAQQETQRQQFQPNQFPIGASAFQVSEQQSASQYQPVHQSITYGQQSHNPQSGMSQQQYQQARQNQHSQQFQPSLQNQAFRSSAPSSAQQSRAGSGFAPLQPIHQTPGGNQPNYFS